MKLSGFLKELLRIIIAAPICYIAAAKFKLSAGLNILMFFVIYLVVAFVIEALINLWSK